MMLELKGNNLPQRQKELNKSVNDAISRKVNFNDIQHLEENSDVDRLFKIEVASKLRNSEYIMETLKSGDTLYISRALKCEWLYGDDYSHIINPDHLHQEVFPNMSIKMKKKLLTTISCHVRNETRMLNFYIYCKKNKLENIAFKFLIFTSETNKLDYLQNKNVIDESEMQNFFGNSFNLVEVYLKKLRDMEMSTCDKVYQLRYLYSISNAQYLNLLETYSYNNEYNSEYRTKYVFGLRLSKSIMTKYKNRVLKYPTTYIKYINISFIAKYCTIEEAKDYAIALLPCEVYNFWSINYYKKYSKILHILPANEIYQFLKKIFFDKYKHEEFEMSRYFYELKYYNLLTNEEKELWALKHLKQKKELLGADEDYLWYEFVNFDLAFREIKKYVSKTVDKGKRGDIVNVLVYATRNEQQLETLLKYYYERHVNECDYIKEKFIDKIIERHNVFKFNDSCWSTLYKILHSIQKFTEDYMYPTKALFTIYLIIHKKDIPEYLQITNVDDFIVDHCFKPYLKYLTEEQIKILYDYYIIFFTNRIKEFDNKDYHDEENKAKIDIIINSTLKVLEFFKKTKHDCPDIIYKYIKLDWDRYKDTILFADANNKTCSEASLIRLLKKDSSDLMKVLADVIVSFHSYTNLFFLNNLLRKLRVYFSNDLAKSCIQLFESLLVKESLCCNHFITSTAITGIFHVATYDYKIHFMTKYAPTQPKISHDTIDRSILKIQESICRFAYYSRPPIPTSIMLQFLKGDYLHFALFTLNSYVPNLPKVRSVQFIASILDAPVSLQKHGIRLAFKYFTPEDLSEVIVDIWKKTKNVSLRKVLYKSLFDYIKCTDENAQKIFYDDLKSLTMNLHEDDDEEIFSLMTQRLPESFAGDYLETAWKTVDKFPNNSSKNVQRKVNILDKIENDIQYVNKEFCRIHILDDLVDSKLFKNNIEMSTINNDRLIRQKWNLAAKYVTNYESDKEMQTSKAFVAIIIKSCVEVRDECDNKFTMVQFLTTFLKTVVTKSRLFEVNSPDFSDMLEYTMTILLESFPLHEFYLLFWTYNIVIIFIKVIGPVIEDSSYEISNSEMATKFASELLIFINSLKQKNILYKSFFNEIAIEIFNYINLSAVYINNIDLNLCIFDSLTDIQMPEMFLIAVLLHFESDDCLNNLKLVYDKVIPFNNEEIIAIMNKKILSKSDFRI